VIDGEKLEVDSGDETRGSILEDMMIGDCGNE